MGRHQSPIYLAITTHVLYNRVRKKIVYIVITVYGIVPAMR